MGITVTVIHRTITTVLAATLLCLPTLARAQDPVGQVESPVAIAGQTMAADGAPRLDPEAVVAWLDGFMP